MLITPVVLMIFNRPDLTEKVFAAIRKARPAKLYIIADGPRTTDEKVRTDAARAVTDKIDWVCEPVRLYSETNLGCKNRVLSGLTEVFAREERAIVLEDDCLPHRDFFEYCETLLNHYKGDERIGTINGTCLPGFTTNSQECSCVFTRLSIVWGWAATRKIWNLVDPDVKDWDQLRQTDWLKNIFPGRELLVKGLTNMFDRARGGYDDWSPALLFALLKNNLVNIHPAENLVTNMGFGERATHTHRMTPSSNLLLGSGWSHHHRATITHDAAADQLIFETLYAHLAEEESIFGTFFHSAWDRLKALVGG
jgi:hypothetical protein